MFERVTIGLGSRGHRLPRRPLRRARSPPTRRAARDPEVRQRLGEIATELLAAALHRLPHADRAAAAARSPAPRPALAKVTTVNAAIAAGDLIADVLGPDALDDDAEWAYMISFLPGLKSAGGTEEILRNTVGERVLGLPPEPRLDKGIPFCELRAKEREAATRMNFALSDEQEFLREAARGALSRVKTVEAARDALEGGELPDLWPTAREAGWPGLLIAEEHGGAGLGAFDAMLVIAASAAACSRACRCSATCPPPRCSTRRRRRRRSRRVAARRARAAFVPARPPGDLDGGWTVDAARRQAPRRRPARESTATATRDRRRSPGCPTRPAPTCSSSSAPTDGAPSPRGRGRRRRASRRSRRYDATRSLGHVTLDGAAGAAARRRRRTRSPRAWYLAQALLAAESLGAVETALEISVAYAKERFTFGRAIGSYQAVKHALTEILRRLENARSLLYYAGWAGEDAPEEFPLAAQRGRASAAGAALDHAAREKSPCTAASARRGSTTRRCTSAARSSRAGCSAAPATRPTASPASCSPLPRPRTRDPPRGDQGRPRGQVPTVIATAPIARLY